MAGEDEQWWEEMDVETCISLYSLDEGAAQALRSCPEDVIGRVMAQGPLTGDNPSALIMSRLRTEAEGMADDPETFVAMVDDRAKAVFNQQSEAVKQIIMEEGALLGYNPSAILMGRLRKAKDAAGEGGGRRSKAGGAPAAGRVQPVARKAVPLQPAANTGGAAGGSALHSLGVEMCLLNSAMWDFDVPREDLMAAMKETLKTRDAAVAEAWAEWPADAAAEEPRRKKARQALAGGNGSGQQPREADLSTADQEQRREAVRCEVVRMLQEAGGSMPLQDIGSKHLTELRKGAVGNLSKFLSSMPNLVTVTSSGDASTPGRSSATVTLL